MLSQTVYRTICASQFAAVLLVTLPSFPVLFTSLRPDFELFIKYSSITLLYPPIYSSVGSFAINSIDTLLPTIFSHVSSNMHAMIYLLTIYYPNYSNTYFFPSFAQQEDMVCLSCTATGERVCLAAEGFGNRTCFLENIADKVRHTADQHPLSWPKDGADRSVLGYIVYEMNVLISLFINILLLISVFGFVVAYTHTCQDAFT